MSVGGRTSFDNGKQFKCTGSTGPTFLIYFVHQPNIFIDIENICNAFHPISQHKLKRDLNFKHTIFQKCHNMMDQYISISCAIQRYRFLQCRPPRSVQQSREGLGGSRAIKRIAQTLPSRQLREFHSNKKVAIVQLVLHFWVRLVVL